MRELFGAGRTLVMGVINMTPDSFSDGGHWFAPEDALARGHRLVADGADILDVGGESTRPGAMQVDAGTETDRILGTVSALAAEGHVVSVDTFHAATAAAAVRAGARIVNDVSGGTADPGMHGVVADLRVPYIIQHSRGGPATMGSLATYDDVVTDVIRELEARVQGAVNAGIAEDMIVLDPGLGFAKDGQQNWEVLAALDRFVALGFPVLVGASRKRFLSAVLPPALTDSPVERDHATAAVSALAAAAGAWAVRVHEARSSRDAVRVAASWKAAAR